MSKFRAIPVTGCTSCRYAANWSTSGIFCEKMIPDRLIARTTRQREAAKNSTPDWCPLPLVTYAEPQAKGAE